RMETRDMPIYNLVVTKDGPKVKASADQTPPGAGRQGPPQPCEPASANAAPAPAPPPLPLPGQRGGPGHPNFVLPRGVVLTMGIPTGQTLQASAMPISTLAGLLQQQVGRPVVDKTGLKGLFDFKLEFSREGLAAQGNTFGGPPPPGPGPGAAAPGAAV